jgi:hypothetical protein
MYNLRLESTFYMPSRHVGLSTAIWKYNDIQSYQMLGIFHNSSTDK